MFLSIALQNLVFLYWISRKSKIWCCVITDKKYLRNCCCLLNTMLTDMGWNFKNSPFLYIGLIIISLLNYWKDNRYFIELDKFYSPENKGENQGEIGEIRPRELIRARRLTAAYIFTQNHCCEMSLLPQVKDKWRVPGAPPPASLCH